MEEGIVSPWGELEILGPRGWREADHERQRPVMP